MSLVHAQLVYANIPAFWCYQESTRPTSKSGPSCERMRKKVSLKLLSILTMSVPRNELCSYLRAAISEQRRIDATYASHEGSISSSQAAALSIEARPDKEADVRLVLPPEPQPGKGGKIKSGQRKHRHTTKAGLPSQNRHQH